MRQKHRQLQIIIQIKVGCCKMSEFLGHLQHCYSWSDVWRDYSDWLFSFWKSEHERSSGSMLESWTGNALTLFQTFSIKTNILYIIYSQQTVPVSSDGDGETIILFSGILHARHFRINSEAISGFTIELLQKTNTQTTQTAIMGFHCTTPISVLLNQNSHFPLIPSL